MANINNNNKSFFKSLGSLISTTASASANAVDMLDESVNFIKDELAPTLGKGFRTLNKVANAGFDSANNIIEDWESYNEKESLKVKIRSKASKKLYSSKEYEALVSKQVRLELEDELRADFSDEEVKELLKAFDASN